VSSLLALKICSFRQPDLKFATKTVPLKKLTLQCRLFTILLETISGRPNERFHPKQRMLLCQAKFPIDCSVRISCNPVGDIVISNECRAGRLADQEGLNNYLVHRDPARWLGRPDWLGCGWGDLPSGRSCNERYPLPFLKLNRFGMLTAIEAKAVVALLHSLWGPVRYGLGQHLWFQLPRCLWSLQSHGERRPSPLAPMRRDPSSPLPTACPRPGFGLPKLLI